MKHFLLSMVLAISCLGSQAQNVVAHDDNANTTQNHIVCIDVLKNDDGKPFATPSIVQNAKNGTVSYNDTTQIFCYTPNTGFSGVDSFRYKVCQTGTNTCSEAWVRIGVSKSTECVANFTFVRSTSGGPRAFTFTNKSTGEYANILNWSFGDSTTSSSQEVTHTFTHNGKFNVCLTIGSPNTPNCNKTVCKSVQVGDTANTDCNAEFMTTITKSTVAGKIGHVTLIKQRTKFQSSVDWGDGSPAEQDTDGDGKLEHDYSETGEYNVCNYIDNNICVKNFCKTIFIQAENICDATFTTTVTKSTKKEFVGHVTLLKREKALGSNIDFGDNSPIVFDSTGKVEHDYINAGTYIVCNSIDAGSCVASYCDSVIVKVADTTQPKPCAVDWRFEASGPLNIKFINNSKGEYAGIVAWDFGDNSPINHDNSPVHKYAKAGNYTVCLTIGSPNTPDCNKTFCKTVTVKDSTTPPPPCVANFSWAYANSGSSKREIHFTNKSTGEYANIVSWNFGDGTTSTEKNPIHLYNESGSYVVCVTIGSPNTPKCNKTYCDTILASNDTTVAPCKTSFTFAKSTNNGRVVIFTNHSTGKNGDVYVWRVNDRPRSTSKDFEYNFENDSAYKAGQRSFEVCLMAGSPNTDCRGKFCAIIKIENTQPTVKCNSGFSAEMLKGDTSAGVSVRFMADAAKQTNPTPKFSWNFGDGGTSDNPTPFHKYEKEGQYRICLRVVSGTDTCMRCETYSFKKPEPKPCDADMYAYQSKGGNNGGGDGGGCNEYVFGVYAKGDQAIDSADIDFGDGSPIVRLANYDLKALKKYATVGKYTVCATIYLGNCKLTRCKDIEVKNGSNYISGSVFFDRNGNGSQDYDGGSYDIGIERNIHIRSKTSEAQLNLRSIGGYYYAELPDTGTYIVECEVPAGWNQTSPSPVQSYTVHISDYCTNVYGKNFGQKPNQEVQDLKTTVFIGRIRPGFNGEYYIYYQNLGGNTMNGTVEFDYNNAKLGYNYSVPAHTTATSGHNTYDFTGLTPGETRYITVYITAVKPPSLNVGDTLCATSTIKPIAGDANPSDNVSYVCGPVRGSFDPNDKAVLPAGVGNGGEVLNSQLLTYTIRFQNTGTDTAFNVVLLDTLDKDLDASTLQVLAASSPVYSYNYNDANRLLTFSFDNILLVDSFTNEALSHGFVTYSIKANENLPIGTRITNKADIYFDFNEPVATNRTLNTISLLQSVNSKIPEIYAQVIPNPFSGMATLSFDNISGKAVNIIITDITGKIVRKADNVRDNKYIIEQNELNAGMYFYNIIQSGTVVSRGKVVVE